MRCFFFLFERLKVNDLYDEKGVCCVCAGALGLASLFAAVFERPTLRGCQRWATLCRVKAHRALTLPCQKTNPDGVILGGKRVGMVVCGNRLSLMGLFETRMNGEWVPEDQWIIFNGLLLVASIEEWRWKHGGTGFRRSNGYSSMDVWREHASKNGDGIDGKRAFTPCGVCGNNPKPLRAAARGRA